MANYTSTLNRLRQFAPFVQDTPELRGLIEGASDEDSAINSVLGSSIFENQAVSSARRQTDPFMNLDLAGIDQTQRESERSIADQIKAISQNQKRQEGGLLEQQNNLGLLRSGLTAAGLGDIAKTTTENIGRANQDLANTLARLALQRSGVRERYGAQAQDISSQLRNAATSGYREDSAAKLRAALEQQQMELEKRRLDLAEKELRAKSSGSGSGSTNPFESIVRAMTQQQQAAPQAPMIGNLPLSEIQNDVVYGPDGSVTFVTDQGNLTREQLADILSGNQMNNDMGRRTQGWQSIYGEILKNFTEKRSVLQPQKTNNDINQYLSPAVRR